MIHGINISLGGLLLLDVCGQQKKVSRMLTFWEPGLLVLFLSAATSKSPHCGSPATLVVRDLKRGL